MVTIARQQLRGISNFTLKRSTGEILVLPNPSGIELDPGIVEAVSVTRNQLGEEVDASSYITENKPVFSTDIPAVLEAMGIRLGKKIESTASYNTTYGELLTVTTSNQSRAGAASGEVGNGVSADDANAIAYVLQDNGLSALVPRVAFSGFDAAATATSWAIGDDAAHEFGDDLVGSTVRIEYPIAVTNQPTLGETQDTLWDVSFQTTSVNGAIYRLRMASARTDLAGSGNIGGENISVNFSAVYDGSSCRPLEIQYVGQLRAC